MNLHGLPTGLIVDVIRDFVAASQRPDTEIRTYDQWLTYTPATQKEPPPTGGGSCVLVREV